MLLGRRSQLALPGATATWSARVWGVQRWYLVGGKSPLLPAMSGTTTGELLECLEAHMTASPIVVDCPHSGCRASIRPLPFSLKHINAMMASFVVDASGTILWCSPSRPLRLRPPHHPAAIFRPITPRTTCRRTATPLTVLTCLGFGAISGQQRFAWTKGAGYSKVWETV